MKQMPCLNPDCHSSTFILEADGRIICSDDDCYTVFGTWIRDRN